MASQRSKGKREGQGDVGVSSGREGGRPVRERAMKRETVGEKEKEGKEEYRKSERRIHGPLAEKRTNKKEGAESEGERWEERNGGAEEGPRGRCEKVSRWIGCSRGGVGCRL